VFLLWLALPQTKARVCTPLMWCLASVAACSMPSSIVGVAGRQSADLQGAAFVFEHFLMPFMKEHISKLDPAFKGAEGTLRSVRTLASYCSAPALSKQPVTWT